MTLEEYVKLHPVAFVIADAAEACGVSSWSIPQLEAYKALVANGWRARTVSVNARLVRIIVHPDATAAQLRQIGLPAIDDSEVRSKLRGGVALVVSEAAEAFGVHAQVIARSTAYRSLMVEGWVARRFTIGDVSTKVLVHPGAAAAQLRAVGLMCVDDAEVRSKIRGGVALLITDVMDAFGATRASLSQSPSYKTMRSEGWVSRLLTIDGAQTHALVHPDATAAQLRRAGLMSIDSDDCNTHLSDPVVALPKVASNLSISVNTVLRSDIALERLSKHYDHRNGPQPSTPEFGRHYVLKDFWPHVDDYQRAEVDVPETAVGYDQHHTFTEARSAWPDPVARPLPEPTTVEPRWGFLSHA